MGAAVTEDKDHGRNYDSLLSKHRPDLSQYEDLYRQFHENPELSMQESETANTIEKHLKKISSDFDIRTSIGGTGLVAILKNGQHGKTVLLRADMDALPVAERTGLDYTSKKTMKDTDGEVKPVMHACGHDLHVGLTARANPPGQADTRPMHVGYCCSRSC